jgi:nanoRNase/pAp phosphatase (c-di-AMP/oligoRNAs hydrolase)
MGGIRQLLSLLSGVDSLYIQSHDFPDFDSVASSYGLQNLLFQRGFQAYLIYEGNMQRSSLLRLIEQLKIPIKQASISSISHTDRIVIVDGCKGNKNVTDLIGDELGVIDHHEVADCESVPFKDIRADYGSCATIIFSYFEELNLEIPPSVSTALMVGLLSDTALMTRRVCEKDVQAYNQLYRAADVPLVNSILRNRIQQKDLSFYRSAIERLRISDHLAFCYFPDGCNQNLLGILGDFFLTLMEVDFVLLCAKNGREIHFSLRSEVERWHAAHICQHLLEGIGFGGGHGTMAGGIVHDVGLFNEDAVFENVSKILREGLP